ncbi:hypothetical protein TVAG_194130 [Trichomonas vaginalis G3]|uniref:Right handed beta helix domain-containing protein n=1 Tax=Trichomonas vaginalis (strain ATCC PRA-98 / G3) TaxID=412133 RepID=A2ES84_TRIV3|nr:hypothetical protein TVAGG3_0716590 [Trichomonas vaginalis G3]EAY04448.1 hypothetical protein TVAG_194130 [Trichomonas vaginalis G3]KAI5510295.1 hypothetical protein TVAGG3_0716590 [Trichomonas vaginalis G3]|eukprot:XP_001316671.1 hypothetical protein [Trichomonas vaginalis G3]
MTTDGDGGSVHFTGSGTIVQHQFCCYGSMLKSILGVYSYTFLDSSSFSYLVESSLYNCGKPDVGDSSIRISKGTAGLTYCNASRNTLIGNTVYCILSMDFQTKVNFSSFHGNIATPVDSIIQNYQSIDYKYCNVMNNVQVGTSRGIITVIYGDLEMNSCSIINNTCNGKVLFCENSVFTIKNCYCDSTTSSYSVTVVAPMAYFKNSLDDIGIRVCWKYHKFSDIEFYKFIGISCTSSEVMLGFD